LPCRIVLLCSRGGIQINKVFFCMYECT
jgi:hypothetical protein